MISLIEPLALIMTWGGALCKNAYITKPYLKSLGIKGENIKPNGGLFHLNKSLLEKTQNNLTKECFENLRFIFEVQRHHDLCLSDESPFGVLIDKYKLNTKHLIPFANVNLVSSSASSDIWHLAGFANKPWRNKDVLFCLYEWMVNYKICVNEFGFIDRLDLIDIDLQESKMYKLLSYINKEKLDLEAIKQLRAKPNIAQQKDLEELRLFKAKREFKELQTIALKKELNKKYQNLNVNLSISQDIKTNAVARVKNQLSYKLGFAMIQNSKSLMGYIRLPFVLSYIYALHKEESAKFKLATQQHKHILSPLESYANYEDGLKCKEHLSYKLGQGFIKAYKYWYLGGLIKFVLIDIFLIKRKFKKRY
ncbi:hypothetical protein [Campylobacter sp. LR196d]|uniref:hypothetical protein n=2 Tax=unclassified Campylobacter TaxID=2593542 RepID=UPI001681565A|nr:hypothetical protein [Campylobacter sp. LR196d]